MSITLAPAVLLGAAYATGWMRLARRARVGPRPWRPALMAGAVAVLAVALVSPLDALAHARFDAHMLQHVLLTMVAAPALLLADPFPALLWAMPAAARRALGRHLVRGTPLRTFWSMLVALPLAWCLHAITIWLWHVPVLYEAALGHPALHALQHLMFIATAVLFWWPVVGPAPRLGPPAAPGRCVAYLVLAAFQSAALGLALVLSPRPLYPTYAAAADALEAQARGGLVMWGVGGAIEMAAVLAVLWRFLAGGERHPQLTASEACGRMKPLDA